MVSPVDSDEARSELRELLLEFHGWMAEHADDGYDPEMETAADLQSLERTSESWAWIVRSDGSPAGCALLHGDEDGLAEIRRLWVRPVDRDTSTGRALVRTLHEKARAQGYNTLRLTTPLWAEPSHTFYESMGFELLPPYPGTRLHERYHADELFMQLALDDLEGVIQG